LDIDNLKAFIQVAQEKSFSRSAEILHLTQPAISKRIASLETKLSTRLFDRVGRTVHLTEAGELLLPSALRIDAEISRIKNEIFNRGNALSGNLSVGVSQHVDINHLGTHFKSFKNQNENVNIDLRFLPVDRMLGDLEQGRIDIGFCTMCDGWPNQKRFGKLNFDQIRSEPLKVSVDRNHPLTAEHSVSVNHLAEYPAILPQPLTAARVTIDHWTNRHNIKPTVSMETTDFATARAMACAGFGWTFLPESEIDDSLAEVDVESVASEHTVALVRNKERSISRAGLALESTLRDQPALASIA